MASWSLLTALSGYAFDLGAGVLGTQLQEVALGRPPLGDALLHGGAHRPEVVAALGGRLDEVAAEANLLCLVIDHGAGPTESFASRGTANLESRFLEYTECSNQNPLDLLSRQHLERRPRYFESRQRREHGSRGTRAAPDAAATRGWDDFAHGSGSGSGGPYQGREPASWTGTGRADNGGRAGGFSVN